MASGFGLRGGISRCYPFYAEFEQCLKQADSRLDCVPQREDYFECLHHKKEHSRIRRIHEQMEINAKAESKKKEGDSGGSEAH
eukprot:CAMPEP_0171299604 /NCGR_PEP_ID=MMETSP0816-20121228/8445_1 /TAXON_ID=420281 /ORGANISM="Proboscia inermis, Strain CCAP1064/1" /LENGTH=82 /DNA_ID=CAMNT_0011775541 /DNA_START=106 /DNA_END=354 /DNA_ORIENTATION=-